MAGGTATAEYWGKSDWRVPKEEMAGAEEVWTWKDESHNIMFKGRAIGPEVVGIWPEEEKEERRELRLRVSLNCVLLTPEAKKAIEGKGYELPLHHIFPETALEAFWYTDERYKRGSKGWEDRPALIARELPLNDDWVGYRGGELYHVLEVAIGIDSEWKTSLWTKGGGGAYYDEKARKWETIDAAKRYTYRLAGIAGENRNPGKRLTEAEASKLMNARLLRLRHALPGKEGKYAEWHIPLRGSNKAIEEAIRVCQGAHAVQIGGRTCPIKDLGTRNGEFYCTK